MSFQALSKSGEYLEEGEKNLYHEGKKQNGKESSPCRETGPDL